MDSNDKNSNLKFVFRIGIQNIIVRWFAILLILLIGLGLQPSLFNLDNKYFEVTLSIVIVYTILKEVNFGKNLYSTLNNGDYVSNIKKNHINPIKHLNKAISTTKLNLDEIKEKLNLIKAFSPVPIVVFVLGLVTNGELLNNLFEFKSLSLKKSDWFVLFSFAFFTMYTLQVISTWQRFKRSNRFLSDLETELINLQSDHQE